MSFYSLFDPNWEELQKFGFIRLTSEADSLSMRMLVDLTEEAANILAEFYGGCVPTKQNYNYSDGQKFSCFLTGDILPSLLTFCLLKENPERIIEVRKVNSEYQKYARVSIQLRVFENEDLREAYRGLKTSDPSIEEKIYESVRVFRNWNSGPQIGFSNVHGMTGRYQ